MKRLELVSADFDKSVLPACSIADMLPLCRDSSFRFFFFLPRKKIEHRGRLNTET